MTHRHAVGFATVAFGTDLVLVTFSVFAAILGREAIPFAAMPAADVGDSLTIAGPVMIIGWVHRHLRAGWLPPPVFGAGLDEYKHMVNASMVTAAAVGIGCYLLQFELARGFFILAFTIGIPVLVTGRWMLRRSIHRARSPPAPSTAS